MKTSFSSTLAPVIRRYLVLKQALGRRYAGERWVLSSLDQFLRKNSNGAHDLTPETFRAWCQTQEQVSRGVRRSRMRIVRNLCLYRRRHEPECFVPDPSLFPNPHQPVRPYIFSESEVQRLLELSSRLPRTSYSPLRPELFRLVIVLLYTTGLRRGELLRLTVGDYDPCQGTLLIRASKFHKSRLLPLPEDVRHEVDRYLKACHQRRLPGAPETRLIWNRYRGGRAYTPQSLRWGLQQLLKWAKIQTPQGRLPRTHDFRHSFAVGALLRWYRSGVDVQTQLPFLATYMGHVSVLSTYYYLHFIEPLASLASARFARRYGSLVSPLHKPKGAHQ